MIICKNNKIAAPNILWKYVVNWYHTYLLHLGTERIEATISQHYYQHWWIDNIRTHIKFYKSCHKNKKQNLKYVELPTKEAEAIPWDRLSVDLIGPYKIRIEGRDDPLILK